jgi:hypothetical protein
VEQHALACCRRYKSSRRWRWRTCGSRSRCAYVGCRG